MFDIVVNTNKGKKIKGVRCPVNECGIGKARDNLIQLRGWKIAPHHAELRRQSDGVYVEDKTGAEGVLINGSPITRHGPLRTSDKIEIGSYIITVGVDESADADEFVDDVDEDMLKTMIGVHPHAEIKEDDSIFKEERFMWRNRVHDALLEMMDLRRTDIGSMDEKMLRKHVEKMIVENPRPDGRQAAVRRRRREAEGGRAERGRRSRPARGAARRRGHHRDHGEQVRRDLHREERQAHAVRCDVQQRRRRHVRDRAYRLPARPAHRRELAVRGCAVAGRARA